MINEQHQGKLVSHPCPHQKPKPEIKKKKGLKLGPLFLIPFKAEEMSHSICSHARAPSHLQSEQPSPAG